MRPACRLRLTGLALLACATIACASLAAAAQQPPAASTPSQTGAAVSAPAADVTRSDLPPSAILTETLAPFEQTRADFANWSDIETAAFRSTTAQARVECNRLEQTPHEGEEALALARLCSVGMDWDGTYSAARWYTRATAPPGEAAHLALGFGLLLQADLNLQAVPRAITDLREMNERLPLSADTDSIFSYVVNATEVMRPEYGLQAALMRQFALLKIVAGVPGAEPLLAPGMAEAEAWHTLMLLHYAERTTDEAEAKALLLDAKANRGAPMLTVDSYLAARGRVQYQWLGRPVPAFQTRPSAASGKKAERHAAVELIVIERASASDAATLSQAVQSLRKRIPKDAGAFLILTGEPQPTGKQESAAGQNNATYTKENLLDLVGFGNGPVFVLSDRQGRVTYLGGGTAAWQNPQMQAETLIERSLEPATAPPSKP